MLVRAARELPGVDLARSTMIGDSPSDMQAGRAVGARLVLIGEPTAASGPVDGSAASLADAVDSLLT
jgi:D-glycero-D-manno-heptose 1,7-bisphosphate phosphatase